MVSGAFEAEHTKKNLIVEILTGNNLNKHRQTCDWDSTHSVQMSGFGKTQISYDRSDGAKMDDINHQLKYWNSAEKVQATVRIQRRNNTMPSW